MSTRVVFLDFDGVLNCHEYMQSARCGEEVGGVVGIDPEAVARVNRICKETGAQVVVTSTWRLSRSRLQLADILVAHGFTGVVRGKTIHIPATKSGVENGTRGLEIQAWIDNAQNYGITVESFVILDDDSDMNHLLDRLIKTSMVSGLLDEHVERAIEMLNAPPSLLITPTAEMVSRLR
jgi:hypothetical protein